MQTYIPRALAEVINGDLLRFPCVVLLGPRQCGKTTLVKRLGSQDADFLYRDMERPQDIRQLDDPELFLESNHSKLLCLDEIQRVPNLFPVLRGFIDRHERKTRLLLLGSASPDLLSKSAESLAGRVIYRELTPFLLGELERAAPSISLRSLWMRGGYPSGLLSESDVDSWEWRQSFLRTIIERDIPNLGFAMAPPTLARFARMLAQQHGQILNLAALGNSLGTSGHTIRRYLDILCGTYHIRLLEPWQKNQRKRLVKTPKVYFRDSGLLHALWETPSFNDLLAYPLFGASWEGFVVEQILSAFPHARGSFYRTSSGVEMDLILEYGRHRIAIEAKASTAPAPTKGFWTALADIEPTRAFVVAPVERGWPLRPNVDVVDLPGLLEEIKASAL